MGFLDPRNLLFALSLVALVLIYLRARVRATVEVSSLLLFEEVDAAASRTRFVQLDALFWLEALMLTALALAVAGLFLKIIPLPLHRHRRALVFDLAAGMAAREGGGSRLEAAQAAALAIVARATPGEQFAVAGYATKPYIQCYFSTDYGAVRAAIKALRTYDVAASAAALSDTLLQMREAGQIDLFASRPPPGLLALESAGKLRFHSIGHELPNAALTALEPGIPRSTPGRLRIQNLSSEPLVVSVGVSLDGRPIARDTVILAPHAQDVMGFGPLPTGGVVKAEILTPDGLAADNQRFAYAPATRSFRVLVVSADRAVREDMARLVRAINPGSLVAAIDPAQVGPTTPQQAFGTGGQADLAILHDVSPDLVPAAAQMLIFPRPGGSIGVRATLAQSQLDDRPDLGPLTHPLLMGPARDSVLPSWMDPLAHGSGPGAPGALTMAAIGRNTAGQVGVLAFDIRDHRLMDPDLLDALVLTLDVLRRVSGPQDIHVVPTGEFVTIPSLSPAIVTQPDGSRTTLVPGFDHQIRFQPLHTGSYELTIGSHRERIFANYFDPIESELSVRPVAGGAPFVKPLDLLPALPPRRIQPLELALIAVTLVALIAESLVLLYRTRQGGAHAV